jgi:hypothetical protein
VTVDNEVVERLWQKRFGAWLFNLYTTERGAEYHTARTVFFSERVRIVKRMIAAMVEAEDAEEDRSRR